MVLAMNEYREFLSFYPTNKRADYAQYKLGHDALQADARAERDQSETRDAIREFQIFIARYPRARCMPEAKARFRESLDRIGEADYHVGLFYYRQKWYRARSIVFRSCSRPIPNTPNRDEVYFYLAEST